MKQRFLALALTVAAATPALALAGDARPTPRLQQPRDARFVPALRDGKLYGIKVYAIHAGGRLDQPTARFQNGDTIIDIDGIAITDERAQQLLVDNVVGGKADATVTVNRRDTTLVLHSKAVK